MLLDEYDELSAIGDEKRWDRANRNCFVVSVTLLIVAVGSCCAFGQIKLEQTPVAPYQLWVGFVGAEVQADGTIKASIDSKPTAKTVQPQPRSILALDEGYTLKDLEVETVPGLEFVQPTLTQLDGNRIELKIDQTGKFRARAELDYGGKKVVSRFNFTIGEAPKPPPGPEPPPPAPDDVPNEYGLGKVAFANADSATAKTHAKFYRQAGDFLYGRPSLKSIISDNAADARNPERSVTAWLNLQLVNAKPEYKAAMAKAFADSQAKRQYTREDWYAAFNEVADALEKVK